MAFETGILIITGVFAVGIWLLLAAAVTASLMRSGFAAKSAVSTVVGVAACLVVIGALIYML